MARPGRRQLVPPIDAAAFREWARLKYGKSDALIKDAMIAATAKVHRLTVVTRNVRDFRVFGVDIPVRQRMNGAERQST